MVNSNVNKANNVNNVNSMVNKATCYKNPDTSTCMELVLTNCPRSFQNSCVVETGQSDLHKIVVTVTKTSYRKNQPKIIHYRNYKNFSNDIFSKSLQKIFYKILETAVIRMLMTF